MKPTQGEITKCFIALTLILPALAGATEEVPAYRNLRASVLSSQGSSGPYARLFVVAQLANDTASPVSFPGGIQFTVRYHPGAQLAYVGLE